MDEYARPRYRPTGGEAGGSAKNPGLPPVCPTLRNRPGSTAGKSWDEEEHLQFLRGLHAFGKGQWKQISKYYVPSRTPTQVASHAQKHFLRVTGNAKRKSKFAAVDAMAEMQFGTAVTRDGVPGTGDASAGLPPSGVAQPTHAPPSKRSRHASSDRCERGGGNPTSEDTGSTRQVFANGMSLYHPNGILSSKVVPPVQPNGVALGIPLQEIPDLTAFGGKNLPMLKVIKGRIPASSNLFRPSSPPPSQKKLLEDEHMESDAGTSKGKFAKRNSNLKEGGFESALAALADVAAGLADGVVY